MRRTIKLSGSELSRMISESVRRVLNEVGETDKGQYQKGRNIIKALKQLNFEDRGHKIMDYMHEYPAEIAITNINVPAVADCREIAQRFNVEFYTDEFSGLGIFEL